MYLLGFDCGTSSIKATLLDGQTGTVIASATSPEKETIRSNESTRVLVDVTNTGNVAGDEGVQIYIFVTASVP